MISDAAVMTNPVSRAGPFVTPTDAGGDATQRAIVHVHGARPQDFVRIDPQLVAEVQVRVEQRGQQVVGRGDGVEIAVEVQVDLVDRRQRRLAAAGGAALLAEHRPERRLAQGGHGAVARLTSPCVRPMVVTVLPSPLVVGVIAVTRISLPRRAGNRSSVSRRILAV